MYSAGRACSFMRDGQWLFDADGAQAEQHAVVELLAAIKGLRPSPSGQAGVRHRARHGFAPGRHPSDHPPNRNRGSGHRRRLQRSDDETPVYVATTDGAVSKVKSDDVIVLLRTAQRIATAPIFDLQPDRIRRVTLSTTSSFAGGETSRPSNATATCGQ